MPITLGILAQSRQAVDTGAFVLLESTVLGSSTSSVTFASLGTYASTYEHLQIRALVQTDRGAVGDEISMRFNGISTSSYAKHRLGGNGSAVSARALASQTSIEIEFMAGGSQSTNFGALVIDILDPFSSSKNTTIRALHGNANQAWIGLTSGLFNNTASITSIEFDQLNASNFTTGSRFSLYGIKGA
jgi:hypothetical protein